MLSSKQKKRIIKVSTHPEASATLHFSLLTKKKTTKKNAGANRTHHQRVFRPLISFILHLTWEGTLMWNSLMIYCDCCLNACASILRRSPSVSFFPFFLSFSSLRPPFYPPPPLLRPTLQRGHVEGWRQSGEHRRDASEQREARRRSDHADAERPGSPVPDRVRRLCHGWAHTGSHAHTHTHIMVEYVGASTLRVSTCGRLWARVTRQGMSQWE